MAVPGEGRKQQHCALNIPHALKTAHAPPPLWPGPEWGGGHWEVGATGTKAYICALKSVWGPVLEGSQEGGLVSYSGEERPAS